MEALHDDPDETDLLLALVGRDTSNSLAGRLRTHCRSVPAGGGFLSGLGEAIECGTTMVFSALAGQWNPENTIAALVDVLREKNEDPKVREAAIKVLGYIGQPVEVAMPILVVPLKGTQENAVAALVEVLKEKNEDPKVRGAAIAALGQIGQPAEVAMPVLVGQLKDKQENAEVRARSAAAIGRLGPKARAVIPSLLDALRDDNSEIRLGAIDAVAQIGSDAEEAIPLLITALRDSNAKVRQAAAAALGRMGPRARIGIFPLIDSLMDSDENVRHAAGDTLARMAHDEPRIRPALIGILAPGTSKSGVDRSFDRGGLASLVDYQREAAAYALGFLEGESEAVVPTLIRALNDEKEKVRQAAAVSLGRRGAESPTAVLALAAVLSDGDRSRALQFGESLPRGAVPDAAATSLENIANALQGGKRYEMIGALKAAGRALEEGARIKEPGGGTGRAHDWGEHARVVEATVKYLELVRQGELWYRILQPIRQNPRIAVAIGAYAMLTFVTVLLLWLWPYSIFRINEGLKPYMDVPLPIGVSGIRIPFRHFFLIGFFQYHPRVLDAWVSRRIVAVREEFRKMTTVRDREVHVQTPAVLDGTVITGLRIEDLKRVFARKRACVLIWGEGGAGKTSLACAIGGWAMEETRARRLKKHFMIPILIEHDLDLEVKGGEYIFGELLRGRLRVLANEATAPSAELVLSLLSRQRILVIVDGLSELSDSTRRSIRTSDPRFSANALVVTSRLPEDLEGLSRTTIQPMRIKGNRLSSFMDAYLAQRSKRELFDDTEFFAACSRLSSLVGERDITVLLAKLYAEQMIGLKERPALARGLPSTIPELMLEYVNRLNSNVGREKKDDRTIQGAAKAVAWECLKASYRPGPAKLGAVKAALGRDPGAAEQVRYLEDRLRLVETVGAGRDWLKVTLDPLAEYLASLYLIDRDRDSRQAWQEFLATADAMPGAPPSIEGFLLALRDCWLAKQSEEQLSDFIPEELAKRGIGKTG